MARRNPLGTIKDAAVASLKAPVTAAEAAVGLAKGAVSTGLAVGDKVTRTAVTTLTGKRSAPNAPTPVSTESAHTPAAPPTKAPAQEAPTATKPKKSAAEKMVEKKAVSPQAGTKATKKPPAKKSPAKKPAATSPKTKPEPVNVVEKLGLDPAPVEKPKPAKKAAPTPTTKIDAAADPSNVDVTPADVALVVNADEPAAQNPVKEPITKKAAKAAPAKKTAAKSAKAVDAPKP